jgi:hypothetical protein
VLYDGEELEYDVNYSFINIGTIKFITEKDNTGKNYFTFKSVMKSNNSLPFIDVNYEFISEVEYKDNNIFPLRFTAYQYKEGKKSIETYIFDYTNKIADISKINYEGNKELEKQIKFNKFYQDGLSIFYYARVRSFNKSSEFVPVLMQTDTSLMKIDFELKKEITEISEVKNEIETVLIKGFSYFTAVFGLTGEFTGWFSDDEARVPIKAKLNVQIGAITVELKSWKRGSWKPSERN